MPWVRFVPGIGKVEESELAVFMRGSKRNEIFTLAAESVTRSVEAKLLYLECDASTSVRECIKQEEKKHD